MTDRVPTYVNAARLCDELSISHDTMTRWMRDGRIPPPVPGNGKRLWKWRDVESRIDGRARPAPVSADRLGQEIEDAARAATTHR